MMRHRPEREDPAVLKRCYPIEDVVAVFRRAPEPKRTAERPADGEQFDDLSELPDGDAAAE